MSVNLVQILPTEWFNDKFSEIINSEITNPPYNQNFFDKFFFIRKRAWTALIKQNAWDVFESIIEYKDVNKTEVLVSSTTSTKVRVYKFDLNTLVLTKILEEDKWNNARMFKVLAWWESILTSWTATAWSVNDITDSTKSWTVNAYAWAYVYLKSWTGAWALCNILSNTATALTVANAGWWDPFDVAPAAWTVFQVYESLVDNIIIQTKDSYRKYDWVAFEEISTTQWNDVKDAVLWKSIFRYADAKWNVFYSDERDVFKFYDWATATARLLRTWETDILRLYPFWDTLLVWTPSKMYLIKWSLDSTSWLTIYSTQEIISNLWLFSSWAIHYDKWMYFVGSDKRFYSLWLNVTGNQYVAVLEEQWLTIFNYLNRLEFWTDKLNIYSDSQNIYIYKTNWICEEYVYNVKYKWWTKNEYYMNVSWKYILNNVFYFLWDWYIWNREEWYYKDLWEDYTQKIESVLWTENIFNIKNWKYFSILLGKTDYTQDWILKAERQLKNQKYSNERDLFNSEYLSNMYDALQDTMGSSVMWFELMWWWSADILEQISDVEIIKTPIDIAWYICKLTLTSEWWSGIFFGWRQWYENVLNNNNRTLTNVI